VDFQDIGKVCNLMIHGLFCFIGVFDVECNCYDENHFCLFAYLRMIISTIFYLHITAML